MSLQPFHLGIPLRPGATLIQASAGTGKTWSIARLVARLLVEAPPGGGAPPTIDQVLVVTFTRAATAELQDRVRGFLRDADAELRRLLEAPSADPPHDVGIAILAGTYEDPASKRGWVPLEPTALATRQARLDRALRDFDTAAIWTIHGFCTQVIQYLAFESMAAFDVELLQDDGALRDELVDDWLASNVVHPAPAVRELVGRLALPRRRLTEIAKAAVGSPDARLLPEAAKSYIDVAADWRARTGPLLERVLGPEGERFCEDLRTSDGVSWKPVQRKRLTSAWAALERWLDSGAVESADAAWLQKRFDVSTLHRQSKTPYVVSPMFVAIREFVFSPPASPADAVLPTFATWVRAEHARRLGLRRQQTFNDLLTVVADGLGNPELLSGLRARFHAALIDEFQDTDATQWLVFSTLFPPAPAPAEQTGRLLLIGDPKQAIYGFRGADLAVYGRAVRATREACRYTMTTNHRSDKPLVDALNALFGVGADPFCAADVGYEPVEARFPVARLLGPAGPVPPIELRWFDARIEGPGREPGTLAARAADNALPRVIAEDVCKALASGLTIVEATGPVALSPRHIAVLVRTNPEARRVHAELLAHGVPAILGGADSVLESDEAKWLLRWLEACTTDRIDGPARALAVTPLFGWQASELLEVRESGTAAVAEVMAETTIADRWTTFTDGLRRLATQLATFGVSSAAAALLDRATDASPSAGGRCTPTERVARLRDGERRLTNLRHLVELLHGAETQDHLGARGLRAWLQDRVTRGDAEEGLAELRLESDADTVRVVTLHKSKGLEYPVVYSTSLADGRLQRHRAGEKPPIRFHRDGVLCIDIRGEGEAGVENVESANREVLEEGQRLAYVAMTRARHRLVLYGGPLLNPVKKKDYRTSALGILLHGRDASEDRALAAEARIVAFANTAELMTDAFAAATQVPGMVTSECAYVERGGESAFVLRSEPVGPCTPYPTRPFDDLWRRESYSGLIGNRHGGVLQDEDLRGGAEEQDEPLLGSDPALVDEWPPELPRDEPAEAEPAAELPTPAPLDVAEPVIGPGTRPEALSGFPRGKRPGLWVHAVLEHLDFTTGSPADLSRTTAAVVRDHGSRQGFGQPDADVVLISALPGILATPLGPATGDLRLCDIPRNQRLDEVKFDMGIGRAADAGSWVRGQELAEVLSRRGADSPLPRGYFEWLKRMPLRPLCGFLTGSIDLVFRAPVMGRPRWFVADYKTNRVQSSAGWGAPSFEGHYTQPWLARVIVEKNYYIQYMLYSAAVHRYLGARVPGYDYDADFGGVLYLFVRGMMGPDTQRSPAGDVNGVYFDRPPLETIEALCELLASPSPRPS